MFYRQQPIPIPYATPVRRRPSLDFSLTGLVYCSMMLFMGLAAMNSQANLLFGVFGLMIGILLVSLTVSRLVVRRLRVHRVLPNHACVGQTTTFVYEISNEKRFWPSLSVALSELDGVDAFTRQPQCYMLHAAAGMTASVPAEVIPKRRGLHELNRFQVATSFPFGFVKRALIDRHKDYFLVFPALATVDERLLALCRSAENSGSTLRPSPGGNDDFYGVKEYRAGDNPRWIYWKRSARAGELVLKQMTKVAPPRILILVDTFMADRSPEAHALVEESIAMAASLADATLEQGLSVGLCAWSDGWVAIGPTRGKRHRTDLLTVLARLPLNTEHDVDALVDNARRTLRHGTTPVLFTPRPVAPAMGDRGRNGMVVIPAGSDQARAWFQFPPGIDFRTSMPPEQQPRIGKGRGTRGEGQERSATPAPSLVPGP